MKFEEEPSVESILETVKPNKISSAYIFFNQKRLQEVTGSFSITQLAQESGRMWNEMTDVEKKPFQEL